MHSIKIRKKALLIPKKIQFIIENDHKEATILDVSWSATLSDIPKIVLNDQNEDGSKYLISIDGVLISDIDDKIRHFLKNKKLICVKFKPKPPIKFKLFTSNNLKGQEIKFSLFKDENFFDLFSINFQKKFLSNSQFKCQNRRNKSKELQRNYSK